jgi:nitrogen fixation/metabolism regulation signal transduction histidine kinase
MASKESHAGAIIITEVFYMAETESRLFSNDRAFGRAHRGSRETAIQIFEPFFTTKGFSGTGLGLWISKEILTRHRGTLQLRSTQRNGVSGTVFGISAL